MHIEIKACYFQAAEIDFCP